jgi:hypothetical protein
MQVKLQGGSFAIVARRSRCDWLVFAGEEEPMLKPFYAIPLMLGCSPVFAQSQATSQQQAPQKPAPKPESKRLVCQDIEVIGSRVASKRVCMTAEQWKEQEQLTQQNIRRGVPGTTPAG